MTTASRGTDPRLPDRARRAGRWSVVTADSSARFHVRDKLVTTAHGSLPITSGVVVLSDDCTVTQAWLDLEVQGIDTGNRRRDRDLRKPRFLAAATSPTVRVEVADVTSSTIGWTATAVVHARGRSAPLDLAVQTLVVFGAATGAPDDDVRIRVTGRLDRTPLGIRAPNLVVGRFIEVEANLVFRHADDGLILDGAGAHDPKRVGPDRHPRSGRGMRP